MKLEPRRISSFGSRPWAIFDAETNEQVQLPKIFRQADGYDVQTTVLFFRRKRDAQDAIDAESNPEQKKEGR